MESWQDQGIVLARRGHGENGAIVSLLTENNGRQAGYVRGATSTKQRGTIECGNLVDARWQSRVDGNLGSLTLELSYGHAARIMQDPLKLAALQSACALCDQALPEREGHAGLFHGFLALLDTMDSDIWAPAYVMWEIALLRELGFSLNLNECADGGDAGTLAYVSPKTGRAVSEASAAPYKERLLPLPDFLKPSARHHTDAMSHANVVTGLNLTHYFMEHWVFNHHSRGIPEARVVLGQRFDRALDFAG